MRQMLLFVMVAVFVTLLGTADASAQGKMQKYFTSGPACEEARVNGTAKYYTPSYLKGHKPLARDERKVGLEADQCVEMYTVIGRRWVLQKEDTEVVIKNHQIVRRWDCGNTIYDVQSVTEEPKKPEPPVEQPRVEVTPPEKKCPDGTTLDTETRNCIQVKTEIKYINPCPTITGYKFKSKGIKSRMPSWKEAGVAAGIGGGISAIGSNRQRAKYGIIGAVASAVATTASNLAVPDYNALELELDGGDKILVRKNQEAVMTEDGKYKGEWKGDNISLKSADNAYTCFVGATKKGFNMVSVGVVGREKRVSSPSIVPPSSSPIKEQAQVPVRPKFTTTTTSVPTRRRNGTRLPDGRMYYPPNQN